MVLSRGMVSCCAYRDEQHRHKMGIKIFFMYVVVKG
jgi:hypothetical protein